MHQEFDTLFDWILAAPPAPSSSGEIIGSSREGRPLGAFRLGGGPMRVSLIGGCHADEPVGPSFLRRLVSYLRDLGPRHPLLRDHEWWIVPHANPDGEERNRPWFTEGAATCDLISYLQRAVREPPGDDMEFGFPRCEEDHEARPENRTIQAWWRTSPRPFHLHASLHGMAFGGGPWFLVEPAWRDRCEHLKRRCARKVAALGYSLHDVERRGEKGFFRLERGFATRPSSRAMADFFRGQGDATTARLFRPSSMEAARALGGDPLTLVSEMPLFITPGVGDDIGPPDPRAEEWRKKIEAWRRQLARGKAPERITACSESGCLAPMPLRDQMALQWTMIVAGLEQVAEGPGRRQDCPS